MKYDPNKTGDAKFNEKSLIAFARSNAWPQNKLSMACLVNETLLCRLYLPPIYSSCLHLAESPLPWYLVFSIAEISSNPLDPKESILVY